MKHFERTHTALTDYTAKQAEINQMAIDARTMEDIETWRAAEATAMVPVREAFWQDTKDINSRASVQLLDLAEIRRIVRYICRRTDANTSTPADSSGEQ